MAVWAALCAGACDPPPGRAPIDFDVKRGATCALSCAAIRYDVFVLQDTGCAYVWRTGISSSELTLEGLDLPSGKKMKLIVQARCGDEACVRCSAQGTVFLGTVGRLQLVLESVSDCASPMASVAPCGQCVPGPDSYCLGAARVSCVPPGQPRKESCPNGCSAGACTACASRTFYRDADGDGYGSAADTKESCQTIPGYVEKSGDCDDQDPKVHATQTLYRDADGDSYGNAADTKESCHTLAGYVEKSGDCDDQDPKVHATRTFYRDADGDGHGDAADTKESCQTIPGYVEKSGDCDDQDASAHPGQTAFFTSSTKGAKKYDYDCNGSEEKQYTAEYTGCYWDKAQQACEGGGWLLVFSSIPDCGVKGLMITCPTNEGSCGDEDKESDSFPAQPCR